MKRTIRATFIIIAIVSMLFSYTSISFSYNKNKEQVPITSTVLNGVKISYFMYQIQDLEEHTTIDMLGATDYDMLIVEPGFNFNEEPYDTNYIVNKLKNKPNGDKRILLAYIDIGQAEDWRNYWKPYWIPPTARHAGHPNFLITIDPDGWEGNYPVAYWDMAWQNIWLGDNGLIKQIAEYGFDGVYLDWVEAYDDEKVQAYAETQGVNPENEMMKFIENIRNTGKTVNPDFLVIVQNAPYLIDADPDYYTSIIDAIATEDTWFYGEADADWDSPNAGDINGGERYSDDYSTEERIAKNKKYLNYGIPVFTIDYCISSKNADFVYNESRKNGFIPLVTRVDLSKITETPPF